MKVSVIQYVYDIHSVFKYYVICMVIGCGNQKANEEIIEAKKFSLFQRDKLYSI
jgi:hypothetical protein